MSFELNKMYTGTIKGFRYNTDYAFVTVNVAGANTSLIIGKKTEFPIKDLMEIKQCSSIDFECTGTKNINGTDFPKLRVNSINF